MAGGVKSVDGSLVKKNLAFKGTSAAETLSGGTKKTTFKGGGGDDVLIGGTGKDIFFYAKGDKGNVTVENFDYANDQIKIKSDIARITKDSGGIKFELKSGSALTLTKDNLNHNIDASKVLIKANKTLYWFENDDKLYTSSDSQIKNQIRSTMRNNSGYNIVELDYSSNLVNKGIATASDTVTFNADNFKFSLQRFNDPIVLTMKEDGLYADDSKLELMSTGDKTKPCSYYNLGGASYVVKENIQIDHPIWVSGETTIDVESGATLSKDITVKAEDHVICVRRGATLTLDGEGTISYVSEINSTAPVGCGVKLTPHTETTGERTTLIVNGNLTIEGPNYGIAGNGGRHNTAITINGGTIRSTTDDLDSAGIYHSQNGTLTINGGTITGLTSGIEIRAGSLTVTGGKITSSADEFGFNSNGGGATTKGAGVAVVQHTSKLNITVDISGGELSGAVALVASNPQNNGSFSETVGTVNINITGGSFTSTSTNTERKITTKKITYSGKELTQYVLIGKNAMFNADGRLDISISNAKIDGDLATITDNRGMDAVAQPRTSSNSKPNWIQRRLRTWRSRSTTLITGSLKVTLRTAILRWRKRGS